MNQQDEQANFGTALASEVLSLIDFGSIVTA